MRQKCRQIKPEALRACLGHATHAQSANPLHEGTYVFTDLDFGRRQPYAKDRRTPCCWTWTGGNAGLVADYLYLLAHHSWPNEIDAALRAGLASASGKPWQERRIYCGITPMRPRKHLVAMANKTKRMKRLRLMRCRMTLTRTRITNIDRHSTCRKEFYARTAPY